MMELLISHVKIINIEVCNYIYWKIINQYLFEERFDPKRDGNLYISYVSFLNGW